MKLRTTAAASVLALLAAAPAIADTFKGKVAYKNAAGEIVTKDGEVELSPSAIENLKLKLEDQDNLSDKVRFKSIQAEGRKIVIAAFRNVRNMPDGVTLIVKGSLLEGTNGHLFFGDLFTRKCEEKAQQQQQGQQAPEDVVADTSDNGEDSYLDRLMEGVQALEDKSGCSIEYRGGLVLAHEMEKAPVQQQQQQQGQQGQGEQQP